VLWATGLLPPERLLDASRLRHNGRGDEVNLLKGGIVYSNFVTTVSPRHAWEVCDGAQGWGLEATLHAHSDKFSGILNGLDAQTWNPEHDPASRTTTRPRASPRRRSTRTGCASASVCAPASGRCSPTWAGSTRRRAST
jgi:glycogen synthase